jgi:hypothetical protein
MMSGLRALLLASAPGITAVALAMASPAAAQSPAAAAHSAFEARTVADLAALCGTSPESPIYASAIAFCHGFLQGAGQYHASITQAGSGREPLFCAPNPPPTRAQVASAFTAWANANPSAAGERAVDGLARWASATYPCPQPERLARPRAR